jgi:radical SAM protein with 4Fe4S-binding SPASM domain
MIKDLRNRGHDIRLGSPYNFLMLRKNPQCRSGIDRMTIGPDYRIFPCDAFKHISPEDIGASYDYSNLKNHSLKECWERSSFFNAVRECLMTDIAPECSTCSTFKECKSGCMAQKFYAYDGLLKGPDPMCLNGKRKQGIN